MVCGDVHTAGSVPRVTAILVTPEATYALTGRGDELIGYAGSVCVTGTPVDVSPPYHTGFLVTRYRLRGDGKRAPLVGVLRRDGRGFVLVDDGGRRLRLRSDGAPLADSVGRRMYVWARWDGTMFVPEQFGYLGV